MPAAKLVGDKSYSILTDHLGTPYEAYDESGEKVWSAEYDLSERPNLSRDKDNLLVYDKEEPITENLITWVFDENSFVPAAKL